MLNILWEIPKTEEYINDFNTLKIYLINKSEYSLYNELMKSGFIVGIECSIGNVGIF